MAVRNFWVEVEVDGRSTKLKGGPHNKYGGMIIKLYQRKEGEITLAARIDCTSDGEKLYTEIRAAQPQSPGCAFSKITSKR